MHKEESLLYKNQKMRLILKHMKQARAFIFISFQTHFNNIPHRGLCLPNHIFRLQYSKRF